MFSVIFECIFCIILVFGLIKILSKMQLSYAKQKLVNLYLKLQT